MYMFKYGNKKYLSCYSCSEFVESLVEGLGSNWVKFWPLSIGFVYMKDMLTTDREVQMAKAVQHQL